MSGIKFEEQTLLDGVTETTTSDPMNVEQMSRVGLQFTAADITSGNGVFTVEGTIDGTNWVALNMLIDNVTNANSENLTRVSSKTLNSNTSVIVWLADLAVKAIRTKVTVTTDGTYSAHAIVNS